MRILILEDENEKFDNISLHLKESVSGAIIDRAANFTEFVGAVCKIEYDFIVIDLVVPRFASDSQTVEARQILEVVRENPQSANTMTPGVVLTGFLNKAEEAYTEYNQKDLTVITYSKESEIWKLALTRKINSLPSKIFLDFIVICALDVETNGFNEDGFVVEDETIVSGLRIKRLKIAEKKGAIITLPRMGLVAAAITTTQAIIHFKPQLVAMSGICGGVAGSANIYDVVLAETCHQHDAGKWRDGILEPEIYSTPVDHTLMEHVRALLARQEFKKEIVLGLSLNKDEYPDGMNTLAPDIRSGPAASASSVVADDDVIDRIRQHQRKCAIFDMEGYAVYEAARLSPLKPKFFSVKTVVDNGVHKSDKYHRVGAILSAKVVKKIVESYTLM